MRITRWDQRLTSGETNDFCYAIADLSVSRIQDTELREYFTGLCGRRDTSAIVAYELKYADRTPSDCEAIRQVQALFSKRADLKIAEYPDRELTAFRSFVAAERLCRETNVIFEKERRGEFQFPRGVAPKLFFAQRKIASILGDVPSLSEVRPRFGPGATTTIPKRIASARRKLGTSFACSEELLPIIRDVLEELQNWIPFEEDSDSCQVPVEIHPGNLVFVPKDIKTHRTVVVEPVLNSMFQCGIGDIMADRLRYGGVDIRDQTPNQRAARDGSLSGDLATLDLSSASDTVAYELIYALLPIDWALFLSQFRSGTVRYKGHAIRLEKFSSMGNGFTFPLETLIFYSLALSCVKDQDSKLVRAYGDDIIVPSYAYDDLCELLRCVGFIPNPKKSFAVGPFRESCGVDYHTGINIRPCYLKDGLLGADVFRFYNYFVRKGDDVSALLCLNFIDSTLIKYGPDGYGDGHLISDSWQKSPFKRDRGYAGHTFETFTFLSKRDFRVTGGERVFPSYSIYTQESQPSLGDIPVRYGVAKEVPLELNRVVTNAWLLREWAKSIKGREPNSGSFVVHRKEGVFGVSIPGIRGCKLIKICVLG